MHALTSNPAVDLHTIFPGEQLIPDLKLVASRSRRLSTFFYRPLHITKQQVIFRIAEESQIEGTLEHGEPVELFLVSHEGAQPSQARPYQLSALEDGSSETALYSVDLSKENNQIASSQGLSTYPQSGSFSDTCIISRVLTILDDSIIRKRGIQIVLGHLEPYFERLLPRVRSSGHELLSRPSLWHAMREEAEANVTGLQKLREQIQNAQDSVKSLSEVIEIEEVCNALLSEIPFLLCRLQFESARALSYIRSLKKLEKQLCVNYNEIALCFHGNKFH